MQTQELKTIDKVDVIIGSKNQMKQLREMKLSHMSVFIVIEHFFSEL